MLKSTIRKNEYEDIYRRWDEVSPVPFDCGTICGAACCCPDLPDGTEMGIYLLPGEEKLHDKKDPWLTWSLDDAQAYEFPASWQGKVAFVKCSGPGQCKREKRPIQCRTFPLWPRLTKAGELILEHNQMDLPYACPLIEEETKLSEDFVKVSYENWKKLLEDPLIYDLIKDQC